MKLSKEDYNNLMYWLSTALSATDAETIKRHLSYALRYLKVE